MAIDWSDGAFADEVLNRIFDSAASMLYVHVGDGYPADAVVMTADHFDAILALVPDDDKPIVELVMMHSHVFGGE